MSSPTAGVGPTGGASSSQPSPTETVQPPTQATTVPPAVTTTTFAPVTTQPTTTSAQPVPTTTTANVPITTIVPTTVAPTVVQPNTVPTLVTDPSVPTFPPATATFTNPTATASVSPVADANSSSGKSNGGVIAGSVIGVLFVLGGLCFFSLYRRRQRAYNTKPELPWSSDSTPSRATSPIQRDSTLPGMSYAPASYPFTNNESQVPLSRPNQAYNAYDPYAQSAVQSGWVPPPASNAYTMNRANVPQQQQQMNMPPYGGLIPYVHHDGTAAPMAPGMQQQVIQPSQVPTTNQQMYSDGGILAPTEYYGQGQYDDGSDPVAAMGIQTQGGNVGRPGGRTTPH
ncbi:hypothetical protein HDV00_002553 [Rhizophlyctis rosea]|nr:hypothetical protein HDV00_002553 [Rhizophlyctis rosea]